MGKFGDLQHDHLDLLARSCVSPITGYDGVWSLEDQLTVISKVRYLLNRLEEEIVLKQKVSKCGHEWPSGVHKFPATMKCIHCGAIARIET